MHSASRSPMIRSTTAPLPAGERVKLLDDLSSFVRRNLAPRSATWPFVRGDYTVLDPAAATIVVTVDDRSIAKELVAAAPQGLSMVADLHSATDAANLLHAVRANLATQTLICVGDAADKPPLAAALLKLGRDEEVPAGQAGSLMNTIAAQLDSTDLATLRKRIDFIDMLGCSDIAKIVGRIAKERSTAQDSNAGFVTRTTDTGVDHLLVPRNVNLEIRPDKTGHFRVRIEEHSIIVDHLSGKDDLLRVVEGKTARDICLTLIRNGWVSRLEHAAYLGRELARAEFAVRNGHTYKQDAAEPPEDAPRRSAAE